MSRTRRRPYTKSKRFDASCRNGGSCPWCRSNRTIQHQRAKASVADQLAHALRSSAQVTRDLNAAFGFRQSEAEA
jgi:hypothetical protein